MRVSQAEFISFGHPLFEAMLIWVERNLATTLLQGAIFTDPDGRMDGTLLFYQGEILDGRGQVTGTRLFALFLDLDSGEIKAVNPAILWDLKESGENKANIDIEGLKKKAFSILLPELEKYKETLLTERERQAAIKEKYGVRSLEHLILKLDGDLIGLYIRRDSAENVERFIKPKEDQKAGYEQALQELKSGLERERNLSIAAPRFIGMVRIVPEVDSTIMVSDEDMEK